MLSFQVVCSKLGDEKLTGNALLKAIFNAVSVYYNYTGSAECFDIEQQATKDLGDKGWGFQVSRIYNFCYVKLERLIILINNIHKSVRNNRI